MNTLQVKLVPTPSVAKEAAANSKKLDEEKVAEEPSIKIPNFYPDQSTIKVPNFYPEKEDVKSSIKVPNFYPDEKTEVASEAEPPMAAASRPADLGSFRLDTITSQSEVDPSDSDTEDILKYIPVTSIERRPCNTIRVLFNQCNLAILLCASFSDTAGERGQPAVPASPGLRSLGGGPGARVQVGQRQGEVTPAQAEARGEREVPPATAEAGHPRHQQVHEPHR